MDFTQQVLPPEPVEETPLVYVKIGDISDQPWPWQSLDYAILTHSIVRYFPKALMMETPIYRTQDSATVYDSQLRNQLKRLNQSHVTIPLTSSGRHIGTAISLRPFAVVPEQPEIPVYGYGMWPIEEVAQVSKLSPQAFPADPDGRIRRIPLLINYQGKPVASQILSVYATYRGADLPSSGAVMGRSIILKDKQGAVIESIPINQHGEMTLRFYPKLPLRKEVEFYSVILASEQQQNNVTPPFDMGIFRNSLVMLGKEHPNIMEPIATPQGLMSPARVQLQALSNLLNHSYVKTIPAYLMLILIYLSTAAGILTARLSSPFLSLAGFTAFGIYLIAMIAMVFYLKGYWLEPSALLLAPCLGWLAGRCWAPYLSSRFS